MNIQQTAYVSWLANYPWELHITTRVPKTFPLSKVHDELIDDVLRPIAKFCKVQVGSISVLVPESKQESAHIHTLLLSKGEEAWIRAFEIEEFIKAKKTTLNSHRNAIEIRQVYDEGAAGYVIKNNVIDLFRPQTKEIAQIEYYNRKLLLRKEGTA